MGLEIVLDVKVIKEENELRYCILSFALLFHSIIMCICTYLIPNFCLLFESVPSSRIKQRLLRKDLLTRRHILT